MGDYMYPDQYEYYENPADNYYEDDWYNGSFDDNGWRTEESSQPENPAICARLWVLMYNTHQVQKDQADALVRLQASLDHDNVCELASPEYVMEGHTPWESQETIERVENVVEEEVVGDNASPDSTAFDVFENFDNVDLVMSESIPSPDNLVDEDVEEEAISDSTDPNPTIPEIFENFEHFENKDLVMGDSIPPPDETSRSLLVPIHLLDDDQEDDDD
ncbi:hypothetical protein L2E82_44738 [Cichorium intybus]|uniref:Uncharacterized protein n=1 Tax=Cichorium intybus TaxID=13427 RepID=A0ACB8ZS21_CICIN|nr:hypothetical protein L2E82_44738 [Cichorium intybus]